MKQFLGFSKKHFAAGARPPLPMQAPEAGGAPPAVPPGFAIYFPGQEYDPSRCGPARLLRVDWFLTLPSHSAQLIGYFFELYHEVEPFKSKDVLLRLGSLSRRSPDRPPGS